MTPVAIVMMIVAILVVWGGLGVAVIFLARHQIDDDPDATTLGGGKPIRPSRPR